MNRPSSTELLELARVALRSLVVAASSLASLLSAVSRLWFAVSMESSSLMLSCATDGIFLGRPRGRRVVSVLFSKTTLELLGGSAVEGITTASLPARGPGGRPLLGRGIVASSERQMRIIE